MIFALLIIIINFTLLINCELDNNVCKTVTDYSTIETNPRCYYNFAADKTTPEIIVLSGYPVEVHEVYTPDGYTLTLHRIPKQVHHEYQQRSPVLLQHGILSSSNFYVAKGNDSLAFLLAAAGYDVWMGNFRGNVYSFKHDNLTIHDTAYWDYTLEDLALSDLPQSLNYIANITKVNDKLIYIGHSLGCALPLLFASEFPEEAKRLLKTMILMAPAYSINHTTSLLSLAARHTKDFYDAVLNHKLIPLLSNGHLVMQLVKNICYKGNMKFCFQIFNLLMSTKNSVTHEMFPVVLNVVPKGGSINLAVQIASTTSTPLSKFDYGKSKNKIKYRESTPPQYNVEKIKVPVYLIAAESDNIISYKDVLRLYNDLSPAARSGFYMVPTKHFTHLDFGLGKYIKDMLNDHLLLYLEARDKNN